jgi:hypothetical protein
MSKKTCASDGSVSPARSRLLPLGERPDVVEWVEVACTFVTFVERIVVVF